MPPRFDNSLLIWPIIGAEETAISGVLRICSSAAIRAPESGPEISVTNLTEKRAWYRELVELLHCYLEPWEGGQGPPEIQFHERHRSPGLASLSPGAGSPFLVLICRPFVSGYDAGVYDAEHIAPCRRLFERTKRRDHPEGATDCPSNLQPAPTSYGTS